MIVYTPYDTVVKAVATVPCLLRLFPIEHSVVLSGVCASTFVLWGGLAVVGLFVIEVDSQCRSPCTVGYKIGYKMRT